MALRWRRLPTTAGGAEAALLIAVLGFRGADLVQAVLAVPGAWHQLRRPALGLAVLAAYAVESAVLALVTIRAGRLSARVTAADVLASVAAMLLSLRFARPIQVYGWGNWTYPVSLTSAVAAGVGLRRPTAVLGALLLLTAAWVASAWRGPGALWTNAASYYTFGIVVWAAAAYLRRLAADADAARSEAAHLATQDERDRQRRLLHDHATVMHLLSLDTDERVAAAARAQAALGAARVRAFLGDQRDLAREAVLARVLHAAAAEFPDLPVTVNADLAPHAVAREVAESVSAAVLTALQNVRVHADATSVLLHAETDAASWSVVVADDGVGFDVERVEPGYGTREVIRRAIEEIGGAVRIETAPGDGCRVLLTGPARPGVRT